MDDVLSEAEVIGLLGRERFKRLRAGGWLTSYARHYVEFRRQEDLRLHPEGRPPVVRKAHAPAPRGGIPDLVIDKNGQRHVVVRQPGGLVAQVRAEVEELLEAARRFLAREGLSC
jgi:hypothetical protein